MIYSQNNEQDEILRYFGSHRGTFVDIGANDGMTFSNTRALFELGWKGVLIEPSPRAFFKLKNNYAGLKGAYLYDVAIGGHNGNAILQESGKLINGEDIGLVSTFDPSEMDRFKKVVTYEAVTVKMFMWKTFLNRLRIKKFDMISLDIEGLETVVLPQLDLTDTKLVCIEWNTNADRKVEFEKYLSGFNLIYTSAENLIYAR